MLVDPSLHENIAWWESVGTYKPFDEAIVCGNHLAAWIGSEASDEHWDHFLGQIPVGQFQQSSIWAQAKQSENWSCLRVLITSENDLLGGFQLLWRDAPYGKIGYVSKGPVLIFPDGFADALALDQYAIAVLEKVTRCEKLRAVTVQPPDVCESMAESLRQADYLPQLRLGVTDATWIVDLFDGFEAYERRMSHLFRKNVRRALSEKLQIHEGGRSDLPRFFELMQSTCQRQNATPSPSELRHLLALWDAAHPRRAIRLYFVEHDGELIVGHLNILFGKTVSFWKKGWNGTGKQLAPNDLGMYEGIRWASESGFIHCDFMSFARQMATAMLAGEELSEDQNQSRFRFFLRNGGRPMLLPQAQIFIPNPVLRVAYRWRYRHQIDAVAG